MLSPRPNPLRKHPRLSVKTRPYRCASLCVLLLLGACKPARPTPGAATATPPPERKGNWAEAMGINPEGENLGRDTPAPLAQTTPASAPDGVAQALRRTLKAADGRTLVAVLLSRTETSVRVRRQADGQEFVIPLEKLSLGDRDFIRASALPVTAGR